jgi:hypothetical protein
VSVRVLFIGGSGRSGTTLLARAVGQLPGYVTVGEVREVWHERLGQNRLCGCGASFSDCPFWQQVGDVAFGGWSRVDRTAAEEMVSALNWFGALRQMRPGRVDASVLPTHLTDTLARLYAAISSVADGATVVDTSKGPPYGVALSAVPDVDFRCVHIVRDSRGIAYSWSKEVEPPYDVRGLVRMHKLAAVASARWNIHNSVMELLAQRTVSSRLKYETFVANARDELRRVVDAIGDPQEESSLAFVDDESVILGTDHTVAGNPNRLSTGPIPLRLDSAWQVRLPASIRAEVTAMTWPMLLRYDYKL